jgi:hypothetical protein
MDSNANRSTAPQLSSWAAWLDARIARIFTLLERSYMTSNRPQY